ncbi:thioesterase family protein [Alteromonas gracilis]
MSERPPRPTRADFVWWRRLTTRWNDNDVFGHLNNAVYFELIDTAVNDHLVEAFGRPVEQMPAIGVVAEVSCRYFAEMRYPGDVEVGVTVTRVGSSSVAYRIGLFQSGDGSPDEPARAEGRFVHVYVDNTGTGERGVVPLPDVVRDAVTPLLRG